MMLPKQIKCLFYLNPSEMQFSSAANKPYVKIRLGVRFVKTLSDVFTIKHEPKCFTCNGNSI